MLDIIRRKASSWVTRAIFGVVVLVFIFFFGYNQIFVPNQGPQAVLVRVNGFDIRQNEFNLAYRGTVESYKQVFKGELPEGMGKMIVNTAMQQLINQRLMIDAAHKMGLRVSDEELAKAIEGNKQFQKEGQFDRALYRDNFLPHFQKETSLNYEDLLRSELLAQKLDDVLHASVKVSPQEAKDTYRIGKTKFTFEVMKTAASGEAAPKQTVGPVTLDQRQQVLGTEATPADYAKIFALTPEKSDLNAPLTIGGVQVSVHLVKKESPSDADWQKDEATFTKDYLLRKQGRISQEWIQHLVKKADIEQLLTPNEG
jgi:hypothetical protein